jgi:UDP-glucuronate 4-epimerase
MTGVTGTVARALDTLRAGGPILVTGANGFVGRALCARLHAGRVRAVRFDREFGTVANTSATCETQVIGDVTDAEAVDALFEQTAIERVVHCGGISGAMLARDNPHLVFDVNALGTLNLVDSASRHRVSRFVLASSIAVYGDHPTPAPVSEEAGLFATDAYGASKLVSESIGRSYRASRGLDLVALRFASIYGPGRSTSCLIGKLFSSMLTGCPAEVSAMTTNPRQFIHVDDCVDAILLALAAAGPLRFAYNIADGRCVSEASVAATAASIDARVRYDIVDDERYSDGRIGPLLIDSARRDLGFIPDIEMEEGLRGYWRERASAL